MERIRSFSKASTKASADATTELLKRERFVGMIYEAAHQDDGIAEVLTRNGHPVFITSHNFLTYGHGETNVITEPRPDEGVAYARKGVEICTHKIALLLPLALAGTPEWRDMVAELPLARIYVLTNKLRYRKNPMVWYLFEKGMIDPPIVRWI